MASSSHTCMGWPARKAEVYTIRSASIHSQPKLVPEDFIEFGMDLELLRVLPENRGPVWIQTP